MQRWEYCCVTRHGTRYFKAAGHKPNYAEHPPNDSRVTVMAALGELGWEMVSAVCTQTETADRVPVVEVYFKRPLE